MAVSRQKNYAHSRSSAARSSGGRSTSSTQVGLTQSQVNQLRGMSGFDQSALRAYEASGSVIGGRNNPNGRGRENSTTRADSSSNVITSDLLKPVNPVPLATPAPIDSLFGFTNATNASLAAMGGGSYDTKTNQIVPTPATSQAPADNNQAILSAYLKANSALQAPSASDNLEQMQKMLRPKENLVNSLSAQLNTITAKRDADMLRLEGQGRGVTDAIIGGQQAQISREAAIQAMPIQAQLAIAQDDLESARTYASQFFQAKMQDDTNRYNQAKENNRLVYEFLTASEQRRLAANEKALDREYAEKQAIDKTAEAITMQAIEYGQSSLAQKIMGLDRKSPTYAQDVRSAMAQLRKPVAPGDGAPKVVSINGVDSVWDAETGQFKAINVDGGFKQIKDAEIKDLSETWIAKNSAISLVNKLQENIRNSGTQNLFGKTAGQRRGDTTNLLLAMKNLEKTGALDKGTIDVLEGTIPSSKFFATEAAQIAALESIKTTINDKVNEYVDSYRGTSAETDPRTQRIYKQSATTLNPSLQVLAPDEVELFDLTWDNL